MSHTIKTLIISNNSLLREGLKIVLRNGFQNTPTGEIVSTEVFKRFSFRRPNFDVILIDEDFIRVVGQTALQRLCSTNQNRVVILCEGVTWRLISKFQQLGVTGVMLKKAPLDEIDRVLRITASGKEFWPEVDFDNLNHELDLLSYFDVEHIHQGLTERETDALSLLKNGLLNKQIAFSMGITESSAKKYVSQLIQKFGARNRTHLATALTKLNI